MGSEVGKMIQQPELQILARQGSPYSLTLDEVQNQLGKPLNSMNLDELLRSLSAEPLNDVGSQADQVRTGSQQGSGSRMISFSKDLGFKTVEQVWKEMHQGDKERKSGNDVRINFPESTNGDSQVCFGEMTLEDFLVNAGVMAESGSSHENEKNTPHEIDLVSVHAQWMQHHQMLSAQHHQQPPQDTMTTVFMPGLDMNQLPIPGGSCPILDGLYGAESQILMPPENGGREIAPGNVAVKIVERKHKRMLKNRESAARSRARRQAYTRELENKIRELEEENEMLRRIQREDDSMLPSTPPSKSKSKLRRTTSTSF